MAGDWIKFEVGTSDKPEVWAIASALNIDPDAVVGKLLRVWGWFDQHTENGNAPSVSKLLLNRLVGVPGFCEEVVKASWLIDDGKTISITNFDRHNGKTAKTRVLTAKRVANHKAKGNAEGNDASVSDALPKEDKREDKETTSSARAACPTQALIGLFREKCPSLVQPRIVTDATASQIAARWRQSEKHQSLEFWTQFFEFCESSDFLAGRVNPQPGRKAFRAGLDWIVKAQNFAKIVNGNYDNQ